jgi:hypothetical protein
LHRVKTQLTLGDTVMLLIILVFSAKKLKHSSENDPCIYIFYF